MYAIKTTPVYLLTFGVLNMENYTTSEILSELIQRLQTTNESHFCSMDQFRLLESLLNEQELFIGCEL